MGKIKQLIKSVIGEKIQQESTVYAILSEQHALCGAIAAQQFRAIRKKSLYGA